MTAKQLPKYELFIHPRDLMDLKMDIWNDEPVDGRLGIDGRREHILVGYRGSHIRKFKKKSYFIQLHNSRQKKTVREFHLNSEYMDKSLMRNKLSFDFFSAIGVLAPSSEHINLYLNGKNQGIYLRLESVDDMYLKNRSLPEGSIFYAVDDDANFSLIGSFEDGPKRSLQQGYTQKCGKKADWQSLEDFIFIINNPDQALFEEELERILDTEKYLKWLAGVVCTQNYDGFVHNYSLYLNGLTNQFEIMPWDYDATWGRNIHGEKMGYDVVPFQGFNTLSARMLDCPQYQEMYTEIMKEILDEAFTPEFMEPQIIQLYNHLAPFVLEDPYLKNELSKFKQEPDYILSFIKKRNRFLRGDMDKWLSQIGKR